MTEEEMSSICKKVNAEVFANKIPPKPFSGYNIVTATRSAFNKYADFSGRATRSEYWWFMAVYMLIELAASLLSVVLWPRVGLLPVYGVTLALFLPFLAVSARRLHDVGKSSAYLLLDLPDLVDSLVNDDDTVSVLFIVGLVCSLFLRILFLFDSRRGTNKYGPSEKYPC